MTKVEKGYQSEPHQHLDEAARHIDAPLLQLDLVEEIAALRRTTPGAGGHVAKTLAKHADLRLVLIAFDRGGRLDRHQAAGRVCIQVLDGHIAVRLGDQTVELSAGGLLQVGPAIAHEVEALSQSAILLTVAWPPKA